MSSSTKSSLHLPLSQWCRTFFHVDPVREWGDVDCTCAASATEPCHRYNVCGWVVLSDDTDFHVVFHRAYANEFHGGTEINRHVEELMCADSELRAQIEATHASILTLYLTYQPCHHSGGSYSLQTRLHCKSCTDLLIAWTRDFLEPHHVTLHIKCANVYRALWTDTQCYNCAEDAKQYDPRTEMAREGLRVAIQGGLRLEANTLEDWKRIATLCPPPSIAHLSTEAWRHRMVRDQKLAKYFESLQKQFHATQ